MAPARNNDWLLILCLTNENASLFRQDMVQIDNILRAGATLPRRANPNMVAKILLFHMLYMEENVYERVSLHVT